MTGLDGAYKHTERKKRYRKGRWAEITAAGFLILKGYRILKWRYRTSVGEIDLVATRGRRLVFVEVKARKDFETGLWSITPRQQFRIAQAAKLWLKTHPTHGDRFISFDVILLVPWSLPRHMQNAYSL